MGFSRLMARLLIIDKLLFDRCNNEMGTACRPPFAVLPAVLRQPIVHEGRGRPLWLVVNDHHRRCPQEFQPGPAQLVKWMPIGLHSRSTACNGQWWCTTLVCCTSTSNTEHHTSSSNPSCPCFDGHSSNKPSISLSGRDI